MDKTKNWKIAKSSIVFILAFATLIFNIFTLPYTPQSYEIIFLCIVILIYSGLEFAKAVDNGGKFFSSQA